MSRSVREVAESLRSEALASSTPRGFFPAIYYQETMAILDAVDAGRFTDVPRLERLVERFAGLFLSPWRGEVAAPRCWEAAWDVATDDTLLIAQHLLVGINAHLNHDLPQALVSTAADHGGLARLQPDYEQVAVTLQHSSRRVLRNLDTVSRWTSEAVFLGGGRLFHFSLARARRQAWQAAEHMDGMGPSEREAYVDQLDGLVSVLAYLIAHPPGFVRLLARGARLLEQSDPVKVIAALLR